MDESQHRRWDIVLRPVGHGLTALAVLVGAYQFTEEQKETSRLQRAQLETQHRDAIVLEYWKQRVGVCMALGEACAAVATNPTKVAQGEFYRLYWGKSIVIDDTAVREALLRFYEELWDYSEDRSNLDRLKVRAHSVSRACAESISPYLSHLRTGAPMPSGGGAESRHRGSSDEYATQVTR